MGWWLVDSDTLLRSRFVISPYAETFASLNLLEDGVGTHPGETAWLRAHLPGYRALLAADPLTARLIRAGLGRGWIADFLTPTPYEGETFEESLARVRAVGPEEARVHLRLALGGPLPADLDRDDLAERAAEVLSYVWEETVRPYWDRRRRVLEADVVGRLARVSRGGWVAVLDSLRPGRTRWLGENRLQINLQENPPRDIAPGAELLFVPVTPKAGWVSWEGRERYAIVYPCAGVLAEDHDRRAVPSGLGALVGASRAGLLVLLETPLTTTQLVALTGRALGSVGRHLRVLLDAGMVERRRTGKSVLYVRTAAGDVLVEAGGAGTRSEADEGLGAGTGERERPPGLH